MSENKAVAVVGLGAVLPDANNVKMFWENLRKGFYSIRDVPAGRWDPQLYYDPDPAAPDKTYTKIGAWVSGFEFNPFELGIPIPPRVLKSIDPVQQWAMAACRQALDDYGFPKRDLNLENTAVILGNALAGEYHYQTSMRLRTPEFMQALKEVPEFDSLPAAIQQKLLDGLKQRMATRASDISEDTMPGELSNVIAGRLANVFNFGGANFVTDAACASSLAALQAAVEGLLSHRYDAVVTGGVDRNMSVESFIKFSKIGALSPDGSRPFARGANGFVMGEGGVIFLLKRLEDAEKNGDRVYALIRGIGSSSDGKGKGITAPNPLGQKRAVQRAWLNAGLSPASAAYIEAHGTSTRVGDVAEAGTLQQVFAEFGLAKGSILLGSVKSNIGHLKSAAGAAGLLKTVLALYHGEVPPLVNFAEANPGIDFSRMPFRINTEVLPWQRKQDTPLRAGVSAFGFGGTNFHVVLEEYLPQGADDRKTKIMVSGLKEKKEETFLRNNIYFSGKPSSADLKQTLKADISHAEAGNPQGFSWGRENSQQDERLAISFSDPKDFVQKAGKALQALDNPKPGLWQALSGRGIFYGSGQAGKVAFLFPGQGSQYVNMLAELRKISPVVEETIQEADEVLRPLLGKNLSDYIYVDGDEASLNAAAEALRDTRITQPAMLTANVAMLRLFRSYGIEPDMVAGHSLGEYAALVASGVLSFANALQIVSARGREMSKVSLEDNGCMAAVSAPIEKVQEVLGRINTYVVIANLNSPLQSVIGGATRAVHEAVETFKAEGFQAVVIPVSHAFHTQIVEPASAPLRRVIEGMELNSPQLPVVANVTGKVYPSSRSEILDLLAQQVSSPVQFVNSIRLMYEMGVRTFVEAGPKRVLSSLVNDILRDKENITIISSNHPRKGDLESLREAFCGLFAAGINLQGENPSVLNDSVKSLAEAVGQEPKQTFHLSAEETPNGMVLPGGSVVISGAGLGLPGRDGSVFDDENIGRLLRGENMIEALPEKFRGKMLEKQVTRLLKSPAGAEMQLIENLEETIGLAGQRGSFDMVKDFAFPPERQDALDISTQLAISAGIEALRDASIPLVKHYRRTSKGTWLPDRWKLPEALADETGVIFASAFPGLDRMAEETARYARFSQLNEQLKLLKELQQSLPSRSGALYQDLQVRLLKLEEELAELDYHFDRRFIFRVLAMGHSQFAEYIGARGPNTSVNAACATTTHAVGLAEDWIRMGRCRRVIVIAGDDVTNENLAGWIGTGLLATGAATTEGDVHKAALPFDRRRNGMIMGMGAAALLVEAQDAVRERGVRGICEVLDTQIANSAFHGTRINVEHVSGLMQRLVSRAEKRFGIRREEIASRLVFFSHETYTPARGGSAAAEIQALRDTFGQQANRVIVANTKGYTGHTMGVGIEDVAAAKSLEFGIVPPVANIGNGFEPDPDLGDLNLSKGGEYPLQFSLRLGAGFGSQVAMTLMRKIPGSRERLDKKVFGNWLAEVSGYAEPQLEVVGRTLRVVDEGQPVREPRASLWEYGYGPQGWADTPAVNARVSVELQPAAMPLKTPLETVSEQTAETPSPVVSSGSPEIKKRILEMLSEQTGYPVEMLDPELDLEADLGIDTVKQAEFFAQARQAFGIPHQENLKLADYNTIAKVIVFVRDSISIPETDFQEIKPAEMVSPVKGTETKAKRDKITRKVQEMICEKSGYPVEMLDPELDLEADLGIDTVKQAELFAEVREFYGIPRREGLKLSDYSTLERVVDFICDSLAGGPVPAQPEENPLAVAETGESSIKREEIQKKLQKLVSEKTGYPVEMLDPELDLEADLGIDTVKQAELFAEMREFYGIPRREDLKLSDYNTLQKVLGFICDSLDETALKPAEAEKIETVLENIAQPDPEQKASDDIREKVLFLVSEKTGYPFEMLDLELDLEADLGIDTVKQAELFAEVRLFYNIPRREDLKLSDYNTLEKVMNFVKEARLEEKITPDKPEGPEPQKEQSESKFTRRVPVPVLRPALNLCKSTPVLLDAGKRFLIVADEGEVYKSLVRRLSSRKVKTLVFKPAEFEQAEENLDFWLKEGKIDGLYFLPGLNTQPFVEEMSREEWQKSRQEGVFLLFRLLKKLGSGKPLICATRLDGVCGYAAEGLTAPMGAAVNGFCKAYAWENPGTLVKTIDFAPEMDDRRIAALLIEETLADPGVVEIGYKDGIRFGVALKEEPGGEESGFKPGPETVFFVSGGAGAITSLMVADLAANAHAKFYLSGRSPLPDASDPDLLLLETDMNALQKKVAADLQTAGEKPVPVRIEKRIESLRQSARILSVLDVVQKAGGQAFYVSCDINNPEEARKTLEDILQKEKHLDVVIHAAGVEKSHRLDDKTFEEFCLVYDVKTNGYFNILKALQEVKHKPQVFITFSSIAGRFGNAGQTDYSAANHLLSMLSADLQHKFPARRFISLDWGAWAEVGMASRGSVPRFMERAGIEMLHPRQAVPLLRQELTSGSRACEVVLAGELGLLLRQRDRSGGLDLEKANQALTAGEPLHSMLTRLSALDLYQGITLEAELDPTEEPFLKDHALDGTPLLPGVMGIEGFRVAARHVASTIGSAGVGFKVSLIEDVHFLAPFKFYGNQTRKIFWQAQVLREASGLTAQVKLESFSTVKNKTSERVLHFTGRVHLVPQSEPAQEEQRTSPPHWNGEYTLPAENIYRLYFHGPAFQVLEGVQQSGKEIIGKMRIPLLPLTAEESLKDQGSVLDMPMLIELCFQTAGIWEIAETGSMSLPVGVGNVKYYSGPGKSGEVFAEVIPQRISEGKYRYDARVVDSEGNIYLELEDYRTASLVYPFEKDLLSPLQKLVDKKN